MLAGAAHMLHDDRNGRLGILRRDGRDQRPMLFQHRPAPAERHREAAIDGGQRIALPPPEFDRNPIVVALVHGAVKGQVEFGHPGRIAEIDRFVLVLDRFEALDIDLGGQRHEATHQPGLDQFCHLEDIAHKGFVDGPDPGAAIAGEHHQPFAPQLLQRLAHRIGAGAIAGRKAGDNQPLARRQPAEDDILAQRLIDKPRIQGTRRRGRVFRHGNRAHWRAH